MVHSVRQRFTFEEYLRLEGDSSVKHEFLDGHVWAMAGGTPEHAAIAVNISTFLSNGLRGGPGRPYSSDLRVRVTETGLGTYPDVTVVCGPVVIDPEDKSGTTATNPTLLVEVLSPSTEEYDRGEKLAHYKRIDALKAVLLVAHDEERLELWHRDADTWHLAVATEGELPLSALGLRLPVAEVYRG